MALYLSRVVIHLVLPGWDALPLPPQHQSSASAQRQQKPDSQNDSRY